MLLRTAKEWKTVLQAREEGSRQVLLQGNVSDENPEGGERNGGEEKN
jgi:hypothetical protein